MLPSLCRLCIITEGSSLESDIDAALDGRLLVLKGFSWLRLWSACWALRFRLRRKKNRPPAMPQMTATPTTTPAAIPAVFGPFDAFSVVAAAVAFALVCPGAVTTIVVPFVTIVAGASLVVLGSGGTDAFGLDVDVDVVAALELVLELESEPDDEDPDEPCMLVTAFLVPVRYTDQRFDPPPNHG